MIIDTNVYSKVLLEDNDITRAIVNKKRIFIPIYVIAELRFGFLNGTKNEYNLKILLKLLSKDFVEVLYPSYGTAEHYAELAKYCRSCGRILGNNDLWIAALAVEHNLPLATYDKDFEVFSDYLGDKLNILS